MLATIEMPTASLSDSEAIGKRITLMRESKRMTQDELARLVGKSRPAISAWESGRSSPTLAMLPEVAYALNCSPAYLAFGLNKGVFVSYVVPLAVYHADGAEIVGEMALDERIARQIGVDKVARLRATALPRDGMYGTLSKGDRVIVDESSVSLKGAQGDPFLIFNENAIVVAHFAAIPGSATKVMMRIGGTATQVEKSKITVIGKIVATVGLAK